MPRVKVQVTLPSEVAAALDRRARHHPRGRAGLVASLCEAYTTLIAAPRAESVERDVAAEVEEMFRRFTEGEAPDYGAVPVRHPNRHE